MAPTYATCRPRLPLAQGLWHHRVVPSSVAEPTRTDDRVTREVGERANWAMLSADPWRTDPDEWRDITASEARIDDEMAYQA